MNEMTLFGNVRWFTTKEICEMCGVDEITFRRFKAKVTFDTDVEIKKEQKNLVVTCIQKAY